MMAYSRKYKQVSLSIENKVFIFEKYENKTWSDEVIILSLYL